MDGFPALELPRSFNAEAMPELKKIVSKYQPDVIWTEGASEADIDCRGIFKFLTWHRSDKSLLGR